MVKINFALKLNKFKAAIIVIIILYLQSNQIILKDFCKFKNISLEFFQSSAILNTSKSPAELARKCTEIFSPGNNSKKTRRRLWWQKMFSRFSLLPSDKVKLSLKVSVWPEICTWWTDWSTVISQWNEALLCTRYKPFLWVATEGMEEKWEMRLVQVLINAKHVLCNKNKKSVNMYKWN